MGEQHACLGTDRPVDRVSARLRCGRPRARGRRVPPQGVLNVLRRVLVVIVVLACAVGVVAYQATRPARAPASPRVFVPSPKFFEDFSPSFRTSIADAYYLYMVQYYGEHRERRPALRFAARHARSHHHAEPALHARLLLRGLRPHRRGSARTSAYEMLKRGFAANPSDWHFPAYLGFFAYAYGQQARTRTRVAAAWYEQAAAIPGRPAYIPRLAADLLGKGGESEEGRPHVGLRSTRQATSTRSRRRSQVSRRSSRPTRRRA